MKRRIQVFSLSTIHDLGGKDRRPLIRLQGKWLQDLGFQSEDKIAVEENNGSLLIKAVPDGTPTVLM
ncbi:MAG TPA: SymE family type I addiction module toxin [Negativicutes bacterium]